MIRLLSLFLSFYREKVLDAFHHVKLYTPTQQGQQQPMSGVGYQADLPRSWLASKNPTCGRDKTTDR